MSSQMMGIGVAYVESPPLHHRDSSRRRCIRNSKGTTHRRPAEKAKAPTGGYTHEYKYKGTMPNHREGGHSIRSHAAQTGTEEKTLTCGFKLFGCTSEGARCPVTQDERPGGVAARS